MMAIRIPNEWLTRWLSDADEKRPTCARCHKAGYRCDGYQRALEIRNHSFTSDAKMVTSKPKQDRSTDRPMTVAFVLNEHASSSAIEPGIPQSMSLVAFKDDIEFTYLLDNFVWRTYGTPWLEMSCSGKLGELPLNAARAFAQSVFGKQHHQKSIELQGQARYGHTIRSLSEALNHVARPGSEDLIVSVLLLLMHAVSLPVPPHNLDAILTRGQSTAADRQAAMFHVIGLNKVIQSCEPARFARIPLRLAFESARSTLVGTGFLWH